MSKFKKGDKVIAISKSTGCFLEESVSIKLANEGGRNFLRVIETDDRGRISCSGTEDHSGDFFLECDLILYEEEMELKKVDILTFKVRDIIDLVNKKILLEDDEITFSRV